jgi:hypothetical protein
MANESSHNTRTHAGSHEQGVCHTVALQFTLEIILRQKKNYQKFKNFTMQK